MPYLPFHVQKRLKIPLFTGPALDPKRHCFKTSGMGEEIEKSRFTKEDFREFDRRLREEADLLEVWFSKHRFAETEPYGGYELEACMVDEHFRPAPKNHEFLKKLGNPLVVHELSLFNVEFNGEPEKLTGKGLSRLHKGLEKTWKEAQKTAAEMGLKILMIGILPTLKNKDLCPGNMSYAKRYKAINQQILHLRKGKPIEFSLKLNDGIKTIHTDVMLEAAATSFQIHLKVRPGNGIRYYNASKIASAPMVGIAANSPYLFGRNLWAETRIPLFERAVSVGKWDYCERVTFGVRYIENSLFGVFQANRQRYPVLLPKLFDAPPKEMRHTRLHNGTIWRWTRPIIGRDKDGAPHLRIEHRPIPAGPTVIDQIANMAFFYGLVEMLVKEMPDLVWDIPFFDARDNFYQAARHGLEATVVWKEQSYLLKDLILEVLLPLARQGLRVLGIDQEDSDSYLGIIEARAKSGQNGATWQRAFMAGGGKSMEDLCAAYFEHQEAGHPVHEWPV